MIRFSIFLLAVLCSYNSSIGQTATNEQDIVYVYHHPMVADGLDVLPKHRENEHAIGMTLKLKDGSVHISNGMDWIEIVSVVESGASDGKTIKGNGEIGDEYRNGWSVNYENVNGARFVENVTTTNLVYFLTKNQDYEDGDLIFARTSSTGILRLNIETGESYTINGGAFFVVPALSDAILQYNRNRDNWSIIGGSGLEKIILDKVHKSIKMRNLATPTTNYNQATFTAFNQWDDSSPEWNDDSGIFTTDGTTITANHAGVARYELKAAIHLNAPLTGGRIRAEIFINGNSTETIFMSATSDTNSDNISVYLCEDIELNSFDGVDGVDVRLTRDGGTGTITSGSVSGSYIELTKLN